MDVPVKMDVQCKFNDETQRCRINPDPLVTENDAMCYKTEKNRCAVKKKRKSLK